MSFFKAFNEVEFNKFKEAVKHLETNEEQLHKSYTLINELDYNNYDKYLEEIIKEFDDVRNDFGIKDWSETTVYEMLLGVIMKRVSRKISRVTKYNLMRSGVVWAGITGFEPFSVSVSDQGNYFFWVETLKQLHNALSKTPKDMYNAVYWHRDVIWFLKEVKLIPKDSK